MDRIERCNYRIEIYPDNDSIDACYPLLDLIEFILKESNVKCININSDYKYAEDVIFNEQETINKKEKEDDLLKGDK